MSQLNDGTFEYEQQRVIVLASYLNVYSTWLLLNTRLKSRTNTLRSMRTEFPHPLIHNLILY